MTRIDGDHRDRSMREPALPAPVDERDREQQDDAERRDPDRPEDDRLGPLEDPQQVEEEVEVPVRPRDERDRPRIGLFGVAGSRSPESPGSSPDVKYQIQARPMITVTTTRLMTVSWNIANG